MGDTNNAEKRDGEARRCDPIAQPPHYTRTAIEPRVVIRTWGLNFNLGNVIKYIARAGFKVGTLDVEDLRKAREYLDHEIAWRVGGGR